MALSKNAILFTFTKSVFEQSIEHHSTHIRLSISKVSFAQKSIFIYIFVLMQMMVKQTPILCFSVVLLFLVSCQDEVPTAPIKTGSVQDFPNAIGNTWVYHVKDNLQTVSPNKPDPVIDTVQLSITRYVANDPVFGDVTVWDRSVNNQLTSFGKLTTIKSDTVYFYWGWEYTNRIGLVFPFQIRDSWQTGGIISGDRTTVIDTVTMRLPSGTFNSVYVLENEMRTSISTDKRRITLWFVPDFGFIKIHVHEEHPQAIGDTTWTLIDHNIPNF